MPRQQHLSDPQRQRTGQRDRALARLSRLTTATAVVGTLATVGFGGLAAITFSGTSSADAAQQPATQSDPLSALGLQPISPYATPRPSTTRSYATVPAPTRTSRRGHVTTGGSG